MTAEQLSEIDKKIKNSTSTEGLCKLIENYHQVHKEVIKHLHDLQNISQQIVNSKGNTLKRISKNSLNRPYFDFQILNVGIVEDIEFALRNKAACELNLIRTYDWRKIENEIWDNISLISVPKSKDLYELIDRETERIEEMLNKGEFINT